MRHDPKYSQSHSSAVKQRPDGSIHYAGGIGGHGYDRDHHINLGKHYHRDYSSGGGAMGPGGMVVGSPHGYPVYSDRRSGYSSGGSSSIADGSSGSSSSGGHASALSGSSSHESEKQWAWLESVLAQSKDSKKFVSIGKGDLMF